MPAQLRRDHGRPRRDRARLPDVRRPVGDAERRGDRHQRRGLGAHRRLLRDLWPAGAGPDGGAALPRRTSRPVSRSARAITNTGVVTWNNPPQTASASVSIDVGGMVGVGVLNGTGLARRQLRQDGRCHRARARGLDASSCIATSGSRAHGDHGCDRRLSHQRRRAELRRLRSLRAAIPRARRRRPNTAKLGRARSAFTNDLQRITDIVVPPGSNLQNLNLPIEPNGVIYNSMSRTPIAGRDADDVAGWQPHSAAGELLRRSGAAGPGHARRAATTSSISTSATRRARTAANYLHRGDGAAVRLRCGLLADHPADVGASTRAILGAGLPGQRRRRDSRDDSALRSAAFGVRAGGFGAAAHAPARSTTCI